MSTTQPQSQPILATPRSLQFALFATGLLWMIAARAAAIHAAQGIVTHLNLPVLDRWLSEAFFLFLLLCGFTLLSWISTRSGGVRETNALPKRASAAKEWQQGTALGWTMCLGTALLMMLFGTMHPQFWFAPRAWGLALLSIGTIALGTLAIEVAFRGYLFRRLCSAFGTVAATVLLSGIYAILSSFQPNSTSLSVTAEFLAGILLTLAYLRTHGLWLGWGVHFGINASTAVLFGLPVGGVVYSGVVSTDVFDPIWFTGGFYGPAGSVVSVAITLGAMVVLYRMTRDYAWEYTHPPIIAAGYPMEAQPPAAHVAMENAAKAAPAPLVQILGSTSTNASTMPVIDEHLKREAAEDSTTIAD